METTANHWEGCRYRSSTASCMPRSYEATGRLSSFLSKIVRLSLPSRNPPAKVDGEDAAGYPRRWIWRGENNTDVKVRQGARRR